jgi:hypothetical protein
MFAPRKNARRQNTDLKLNFKISSLAGLENRKLQNNNAPASTFKCNHGPPKPPRIFHIEWRTLT